MMFLLNDKDISSTNYPFLWVLFGLIFATVAVLVSFVKQKKKGNIIDRKETIISD